MTSSRSSGSRDLSAAPDARQPRLLLEWQSSWAVIVVQLHETSRDKVSSPCFEIVIGAITPAVPAFLVAAVWIGTEEHATGLEGLTQLAQHPCEFLAGHMEQNSIGEDAVETLLRQVPSHLTLPGSRR